MLFRKVVNSVLVIGLCAAMAGCASGTGNASSAESVTQETTGTVTVDTATQANKAATAENTATTADTAATEDIARTDSIESVFSSMLGWVGTAGSSLKAASCAVGTISFANSISASSMDANKLLEMIQNAFDNLTDEEKQQIHTAWESVSMFAEGIVSDDADIMSLLSTIGESGSAQELYSQEGTAENWSAFRSAMDRVVQDDES